MAGNNPKPPKNYRKKKQRRRNDDNNSSDEREDADDATTQARAALAAIETRPEDEADLLETETHNVSSFPTYRRMVGEMIKWWEAQYPEAYALFVYELSDNEKNNCRLHYYNATHVYGMTYLIRFGYSALSVAQRSGKMQQRPFNTPLILRGNTMMQFSNVPVLPNTISL